MTSHRWADLSWQAIRDLPKDPGVVVLPIGAIEQHGPHLPVWTDALLAERMTAREVIETPSRETPLRQQM